MVWSSSNRDARFNPGWERTRKQILERDRYRCQWIVTDWHTGAKHICGYSQKTAQESAEQRRMNRERRKEEQWYSHPAFQ